MTFQEAVLLYPTEDAVQWKDLSDEELSKVKHPGVNRSLSGGAHVLSDGRSSTFM